MIELISQFEVSNTRYQKDRPCHSENESPFCWTCHAKMALVLCPENACAPYPIAQVSYQCCTLATLAYQVSLLGQVMQPMKTLHPSEEVPSSSLPTISLQLTTLASRIQQTRCPEIHPSGTSQVYGHHQ